MIASVYTIASYLTTLNHPLTLTPTQTHTHTHTHTRPNIHINTHTHTVMHTHRVYPKVSFPLLI